MLNISELRNTVHEKRRRRVETFDALLTMCHKRIQRAAELEKYECEYEVPEYVVGLPLFNVNDCLDHLLNRLRTNGFTVQHVFPKTIRVTWFPPEDRHSLRHSIRHSPQLGVGANLGANVGAHDGANVGAHDGANVASPNLIGYKNEKGKFVLNV